MITIRSCTSNLELQISYVGNSNLLVEPIGFPASASVAIWVENGDASCLQAFIASLGKQERPWKGMRDWQSNGEDLKLNATCTASSHVLFSVQMCALRGTPEEGLLRLALTTSWGVLVAYPAVTISNTC